MAAGRGIQSATRAQRCFPAATTIFVMAAITLGEDAPQKGTIQISPPDVKWADAPLTMPAGTMIAVLEGDPKKEGIFTQRLRVVAGAVVRPHKHPREERVTVLSGAAFVGFGDTVDKPKAKKFPAGSFYVNPAGVHHYVFFEEETVLQITGLGPWMVEYLDEQKPQPTK